MSVYKLVFFYMIMHIQDIILTFLKPLFRNCMQRFSANNGKFSFLKIHGIFSNLNFSFKVLYF